MESDEKSIFVRFINETVHGSEYTWDFGDGEKSNRPDPTHEYNISEEANFTVVLTAGNGPCEESIEEELTLSSLLLEFGEESDGTFCETDEEGLELIGTPVGGKFSGAGVKENRFVPSLVDMGKLSKKTVTLQYILGSRATTLLAVVYKYPVLRFTHSVAPARLGVNVSFSNQSLYAEKYVWNFGDGSDELAGYNISHFYKNQGVYQVTLRGINPPCEDAITKTVVAKTDIPEPEIIPITPLKTLNEMFKLSTVKGLLKEQEVNGAYLEDFYRQMTEIVGSGDEKKITAFAMDEFQFSGPISEIQTLGEQMYRHGRGLSETQLGLLIDVYRLSIGNIMNLQSKRSADLSGISELNEQLNKLVELTAKLNPHLVFEKFPTKGFELVPQSLFDDLPNLQKLHISFGKSL